MNLSPRGIAKIIDWETGGESYYDRNPEWPGEASGITIGVGWDLGHTSVAETTRAWRGKIDDATLALLVSVSGHRGEAAQTRLPHVRHLVIPWAAALAVFQDVTIPTWYIRTLRIYPQVDELPGDCAAALVSLVFNRGPNLTGDRRKEMAEIQRLLRVGDIDAIPQQIRNMRRLWPNSNGLQLRRTNEARLFESGLMFEAGLVPAGE